MKTDFTQNSITYYDLGSLGIAAQFKMAGETKVDEKWEDIVVLDVSGSMGATVPTIIRKVLPKVYKGLECSPSDIVHLVAFETKTHYEKLKVSDLDKNKMCAMDCTYMKGAITKVSQILCENPKTAYRLLVISDGAIADKDEVLIEAAQLPSKLSKAGRSAPVVVSQIRAITSKYAKPDTQALTSLGQLDFMGNICMVSVTDQDIESTMHKEVLQYFDNLGIIREISTPSNSIVRLPGSPPSSSFQTADNQPFVLFQAGTNMEEITVDGVKIPPGNIVKGRKPTERDILPLLLFVESQMKQLLVLGNEKKVKEVMNWITELAKENLAQVEDLLQPTGNPVSVMFRRRDLVAKACKVETSVMQRIRELSNAGKVSELNSQRQAEFLKGIGHGSQGRSLAKRAGKMDLEDIEVVVPTEAKTLRNFLENEPLQELPNEPCSFYSHDSLSGCINGLLELTEVQIDQLNAGEIMQFVGPIGFSFNARVSDAPDPWSCINIEKVFVGDSYLLSAADLWTSRLQGGNATSFAKLIAPGTKEEITGVLPIRSVNPQAYDVLLKYAPTLFKLQVAASIRGSLIPMPGDFGALMASCTIKLAQQYIENPVEATASALSVMIKDLRILFKEKPYELGIKNEVLLMLNEGDPRVAMAGDLFIASETKPLAAVLAGKVNASPALARAVLGYVCYLAANRKVRDPDEKRMAVKKVLGIRKENLLKPGKPFSEDPEEKFYDKVDFLRLKEAGGTRPLKLISSIFATLEAFEKTGGDSPAFGNEIQSILKEEGEEGIVPRFFGFAQVPEVKDLAGASALQGLLSPNLSSRIQIDESDGSRTYKLPSLETHQEIVEYVSLEVQEFYQDLYKDLLKVKRNAEKVILIDNLIFSLATSPTMEEFIDKLSISAPGENRPLISDRNDESFIDLTQKIMERQVPFKLEKLWVLILGRDLETFEPVWLQGNVMRTNLKQFADFFLNNQGSKLWEKLQMVHKKYGIHTYREGAPNRHGHSNEFPSWWALGYSSLEDFQNKQPAEAEAYIDARLKTGHLWANPKYQIIVKK